MSWILILWVGISVLSEKDSMAMVTIPFTSQATCVSAGEIAAKQFEQGTKKVRFVCVPQGK